MLSKQIKYCGQPVTVYCDGKCHKVWGIATRPKIQLSNDEDDLVFLADGELGNAPSCNGWWEGGDGKPQRPEERLNKWCVRQCERSVVVELGKKVTLKDWSKRQFNQPWKHGERQ